MTGDRFLERRCKHVLLYRVKCPLQICYDADGIEMPLFFRGNRTIRQQTNSRSVKSRTSRLAEMFYL